MTSEVQKADIFLTLFIDSVQMTRSKIKVQPKYMPIIYANSCWSDKFHVCYVCMPIIPRTKI